MPGSQKIRTALFGGTFNPLHNGHIAIARSVIEQGLADEVWLLVTPCNPWKKGHKLLDDHLRYDMVAQAVEDMDGVRASDYEFSLPKPSYTANTLRRISIDYPDHRFILTIGADNWVKFKDWREADYIMANYPIIVYPRKGYDIEFPLPDGIKLLDCPLVDVSSTQLRRMVKNGKTIDKMVPASVAGTIHDLNLYK